jgi:hypothetical protein
MQRESAARVRRFLRLLSRRVAACLSLAATLAFVVDGALAFDRHFGGPDVDGIYHGVHVHFHLPVHGQDDAHHFHHHHGSSDHHSGGDVADVDLADNGQGLPGPHSDNGSSCGFAGSYVGVMLLCPGGQAALPALQAELSGLPRTGGEGLEPAGPRRPPRPGALL